MKKYYSIYAGIVIMLCWCCSNPVEKSKTDINDGVVMMLRQDIGLINSTLDFVRYAVPENYWYKTYKKDHQATVAVMQKLKRLIETVNEFEYSDYGMYQAKSNFVDTISETYKKLNEINSNGFWLEVYNDLADTYSFGGLIPLPEEKAPEFLKKAITQMDSVIGVRYFCSLPESIFQLERMAIGEQEITSDEFKEIRAHTLQTVRDTLSEYVYYEEEEYKKDLINNILEAFANQYPVNDAYAYIIREHAYSGVLYQFYLTEKGTSCDYENIVSDDCTWGYLLLADNGKVIYRYECSDDSTDYHIGDFKMMDDRISCLFKKEYSHPSTDNLMEGEENKRLELMNAGKIHKTEKYKIELEPTDCSQYHFIFKTYHELPNGNQQEERYVCRLASLREYNSFTNDLKNIDEIKQLFE